MARVTNPENPRAPTLFRTVLARSPGTLTESLAALSTYGCPTTVGIRHKRRSRTAYASFLPSLDLAPRRLAVLGCTTRIRGCGTRAASGFAKGPILRDRLNIVPSTGAPENPRVGGSIPPLRAENTAEIAQSRVSDAPSCRPEVTDGEPTYVQTPLVRIANELLRAVADGREQDAEQFAAGLAERVL
jgi:hypothetical protein